MSVLVLDSGAVTRLARRSQDTAAMIAAFVRDGIWPPLVPSVVLVECLSGRERIDVPTNRLKICEIIEEAPRQLARRAAVLRASACRGSAVDALVIAVAEPGAPCSAATWMSFGRSRLRPKT